MSQRGRSALAAVSPYGAGVRVRVLGVVELIDDTGAARPVGSPSQRTVLAALVAHRGRVVPSDMLVDSLWGDVPPKSAMATLRTYVSRLRRSLQGALVTRGDGYVLDLPDGATDAGEFEALVDTARRSSAADAVLAFDAALALWGGQPFGDQADVHCVRAEGRRLVELHKAAVEARISCLLEIGRFDDAVPAAEALVADEPLREGAWAALIEALAAANRSADALRAYQRACAALADAGLAPSARLRGAERAVLVATPVMGHPVAADAPLPLVMSSFVGRDEDRDRVLRLLTPSRVVTLVGPGGVGKTRLALEVARRTAEGPDPMVRIAQLASLSTDEEVADAVVSALGLSADGEAASDALKRVRRLDLLLVLDNAEHLLDAVADVVEQLLAAGTAMRILVTSRERLGVDGEHVWRVTPLGARRNEAGVRLFIERADAAVPELELSPDDVVVTRVVELLDGLPLAIEMAASQLSTFTLGELAAALEGSHDMLASPRRAGPGRHRTLASMLGWSEQRLSARQREVLYDLSVFSGRVTVADIEGVFGASDARDITRSLAERSLVAVTREGDQARFGLLHTVRTFAARTVEEAGRAGDLARRHAVWFEAAARDADVALRGVDEVAAHERFAAVFGELRGAHRWARQYAVEVAAAMSEDLHLYAESRLIDEPLRWAEGLIDVLASDDPHLPVVLASAAARAVQRGDLTVARARAERAIAGSGGGSLAALETLADIELFEGRLDASEAAYGALAQRASEGPDLYYLAAARSGVALARCYAGRGRLDDFDDLRSMPLGPSALGWLSYADGELLLDDDPALSFAHFDRAIALAAGSGNRYLEGVARVSSCSLRARAGDAHEARQAFVLAIHFWRGLAATTHQVTTLRNLAVLVERLRKPEIAAELLGFLARQTVPTYGAEAARLDEVETWARQRLGGDFTTRFAAGGARSLAATEDWVLTAL